MIRRFPALVALILVTSNFPGTAAAKAVCPGIDQLNPETHSAQELVACIAELKKAMSERTLSKTEQERLVKETIQVLLRDHKNELPKGADGKDGAPGSDVTIPKGAVLAFDTDSGCPAGWTDLGKDESETFAGRTIVAVGPTVKRKEVDKDHPWETTKRDHRHAGGKEKIYLTEENLPAHQHVLESFRRTIDEAPNLGGRGLAPGGAFVNRVWIQGSPLENERKLQTGSTGTGKKIDERRLHFPVSAQYPR